MYSKLQYISQGTTVDEQITNIKSALDGGCKWIQLRAKTFSIADLKPLAISVKKLCNQYGATFIINDHPQLVTEVDADGVHLGLEDMPVAEARKILGDKIIGGTANTFAHVRQRITEGCNYVGVGPYRFTTTKEKLSPVLGFNGYQQIIAALSDDELKCPLYAIGGIITEDIETLMEAGVYGIAVSGIITHHGNKKTLIKQLNANLYEAVDYSRQSI